ncbi:hypothetical protein ABT014_00130, partial [Kitasatospora sp. NPDC094015]
MSKRNTMVRGAATAVAAGLAVTALAVPAAHADTVVSGGESVTSTGTLGRGAAPGGPVGRSQAIARAKDWADNRVPYSPNGINSPYGWWADSATGGRYREDCSGLISMAWQLPYSRTTEDLPGVATAISVSALQPGDALNDRADGHVVLFAGWTDKSAGRFVYYAEHRTGTVTSLDEGNFNNASIAGHPTGNYTPLRYNKIVDDSSASGDLPVAGNWDGGAAGNVGVFRPSTGQFHLRNDDGSLVKVDWGQAGDLPVSANWDGAGPDNVGVFRPSTGQFHLRMDDGSLVKLDWGQAGDLPVAGNWDGGAAGN